MTEPYYADGLTTLYHGDSVELADLWCDADVLVTDPPYGMSFVSGMIPGVKRPIAGDDTPELRDKVLELWPVDKPACIFGTWRVPRPPAIKQVLIWSKPGPGMGDLKLAFGTSHEEIYLRGDWLTNPARARRGSVITTNYSPSRLAVLTGHPTPKPLGLMELLLEAAPPGMIVDPFAGSGATLLAARNLHRPSIGVEIEEKYCEAIAKRLARAGTTFAFGGEDW